MPNSSLTTDIAQGAFCGPNVNVGKTLSDVYIIPLLDLDQSATTFNASDECIIESLSMTAGGSRAYKYSAVSGSIVTNANIVQKDSFNDKYSHDATFALTDNTSATRREIGKLLREDVAIAYQKSNGDITVMGYHAGMRLSGDFIFNEGGENASEVSPILATRTGDEPNEGYTLFITDAATSLAVLEGLLTPTA